MSTEINEKLNEILAKYEASQLKVPDSADITELLDKVSLVAELKNYVPALVKALRITVSQNDDCDCYDCRNALAEIATILNAAPSQTTGADIT